jgi:hypothetical protein
MPRVQHRVRVGFIIIFITCGRCPIEGAVIPARIVIPIYRITAVTLGIGHFPTHAGIACTAIIGRVITHQDADSLSGWDIGSRRRGVAIQPHGVTGNTRIKLCSTWHLCDITQGHCVGTHTTCISWQRYPITPEAKTAISPHLNIENVTGAPPGAASQPKSVIGSINYPKRASRCK